jgi:hypothetical protein
MKCTVKLLEADVISHNNRCYSKEVVEKINEQLNSNTVNVYNQTALGKQNPPLNAFIGQTVKYSSRIEKDTLFVDVKLIKPVNAKFINLCCLGNINLSNEARMSYNDNITVGTNGLFYYEVEEPEVVYLYSDNTNSYYDDSNIVFQNKLEIE